MNFALWLTSNIIQTTVDLCFVNCEMTVLSRHDCGWNIYVYFYGQPMSLFLQSTFYTITLHKDESIIIYIISTNKAQVLFLRSDQIIQEY